MTLHTYWVDYLRDESYEVDGAIIIEAPMYAKCSRCGYSFYVGHIEIDRNSK